MCSIISDKINEVMTGFQSTLDKLLETATKRIDRLEESCDMFVCLEDIEEFKKWLAEKRAALLNGEEAESTEEAIVSKIFTEFLNIEYIHTYTFIHIHLYIRIHR